MNTLLKLQNKEEKKSINYSANFDKFYTKPEIAQKCLNIFFSKVEQNSNFFYIEPSAGNGSFFNILPEPKIGIDLIPECDGIIKSDYFDWRPPFVFGKRFVVIGNFPFGKRGRLQIKFIKHSEYAEYIAFIGSPLFLSDHHRPLKFEIIYKEKLPKNSFLFENKDYDIESYFYIMKKTTKSKIKEEKIRSNLIDCWVCGYSKNYKVALDKLKEVDFFLPSAIFKSKQIQIYDDIEKVPSHWAYAIKVLNKSQLQKIKDIFNSVNWSNYILETNRTKNLKRNIIEKILIDNFN